MFGFKKKNKAEKSADEFLRYHFRNGTDLAKQNEIKIIGGSILLIIIAALAIFGNFTLSKFDQLEKNGEITSGKITGIKRNAYRVNDFDGTRINNYLIQYEFRVNGEIIQGIKTLEKRDYDEYFDSEINVNDTLKIVYDSGNPKNNRILKK